MTDPTIWTVSYCIWRVEEALSPSLTKRGIAQWWDAPNRYLNGTTARHELTHGHFESVIAAAESFSVGDYL